MVINAFLFSSYSKRFFSVFYIEEEELFSKKCFEIQSYIKFFGVENNNSVIYFHYFPDTQS